CRETGTALIWITHDLAVVAAIADEIAVMYAGKIVEYGRADDVLDRPRHPYTAGLLNSVPSRNRKGVPLAQIPGMPPSLLDPPPGCAFRQRCARATAVCGTDPALTGDPTRPGAHAFRCHHPLEAA